MWVMTIARLGYTNLDVASVHYLINSSILKLKCRKTSRLYVMLNVRLALNMVDRSTADL